jgi:hypothetical protein
VTLATKKSNCENRRIGALASVFGLDARKRGLPSKKNVLPQLVWFTFLKARYRTIFSMPGNARPILCAEMVHRCLCEKD